MPTLPVGTNLLTFALSALGAVLLILRALTYHHGNGYSIKWGGYLMCLVVIVQAVAAYLLFKSSGEVMPDFKAMQANRSAGAVPPPPPGYAPRRRPRRPTRRPRPRATSRWTTRRRPPPRTDPCTNA